MIVLCCKNKALCFVYKHNGVTYYVGGQLIEYNDRSPHGLGTMALCTYTKTSALNYIENCRRVLSHMIVALLHFLTRGRKRSVCVCGSVWAFVCHFYTLVWREYVRICILI